MTGEATEHRRPRGVQRLVLAMLAAWALLAAELCVVAWSARARIASIWELQYGAAALAPAWLLLGTAGGLLGWLLLELVEARTRRARLIFSVLWGLLAGGVAWGLGGGRHLAELGPRLGFALGGAALAGGATYMKAPWLARALSFAERSPGRRLAVSGLFFVSVVAAELVNHTVLVRLYPAFHLGLTALALGAAAFVLAPFGGFVSRTPRRWGAVVAALTLLGGALLVPGARAVRGFDNLRLILLDTPSLGWGVQLAARVAPPPPQTCEGDSCGKLELLGASSTGSPSAGPTLSWSGRDIVLITVDALRADRLGIYGNERGLTPELDALGRQGVVFDAAYAPTPHTSYSITSLMTGKYMRPLLLQGAGEDSDTWAGLLRRYEYRTAAFYPPAVFFIDKPRFGRFEQSRLDFEYSKVEFAEGEKRLGQIREYLAQQPREQRVFLWLHLFGPHEPYEAHPDFDFGPRDIDRYDSEVAFADRTAGQLVRMVRDRDPEAVIIVSADHGEEFGEHGGRYHGTTVYEEQVRVPLIVVAPGSAVPGRVAEPVQTIDLLPTTLSALSIPRSARIRGRDLGALLSAGAEPTGAKPEAPGAGLAVAETEDQTLLAEGTFRLLCQRKIGACQLFDLARDPGQLEDVSAQHPARLESMRERSRKLAASHGEFETRGLRAEGRGWPGAILRGISGDADAAAELSELLDDADVAIRRKAAELLFELQRPETAGSLELSLTRDEDPIVRRWAALGLTRLGRGAPLVYELVQDGEPPFRRLAALALAEAGDARGARQLVAWWADGTARDFERSRQLLQALAKIRSKDAVGPLVQSLDDVRLRPEIARALATIGDKDARVFLVRALRQERYQSARSALVESIVALGGKGELVAPLVRFLGVPDPLEGGLDYAQRAGILHHIGGPKDDQLRRVRSLANSGVVAHLNVPPGGNGSGVRLLLRATARGEEPGRIYVQKGTEPPRESSKDSRLKVRYRPTIEQDKALEVRVAQNGDEPAEVAVTLPADWRAKAGHPFALALFADQNVQVEALALVPLADELPPPEPVPWEPK